MFQQYRYQILISGIAIHLISDQELQTTDSFRPFLRSFDHPDYVIHLRKAKKLPQIPKDVIYEDIGYRVHQDENKNFFFSFRDAPQDDSTYAVARCDYQNGLIQVDYLGNRAQFISEMGNSFAHLNFEGLLLHKRRLCLHASCVDTPYGGILFSGPSGIGKSTQAGLWCDLRDARQINGDRPILSRDGDRWLAWGSPYAGSSRCHINESCPVRAIVMLVQGPACSIRRLKAGEAFRKVWSGLTVHSWDTNYVNTACDLAQGLIEAVPVYELTCTPDENAVLCLENVLRRECGQ